MSNIPKSKRGKSQLNFYVFGLKMVKNIMCYICENFGLMSLQHNVLLFAKNNTMTDYDKGDLERLAKTYHLSVENSHLYTLIDKFRDNIMDHCFDFLFCIVEANTVYPNSEYELNLRKQYVWKAISHLEYILCLLQLIMEMTTKEKDLKTIKLYLDDIKKEIEILKSWKKDCNRLNKTARTNEATRLASIEIQKNKTIQLEIQKEINKRIRSTQTVSSQIAYQNAMEEASKRLCETWYSYNNYQYKQFFDNQFVDQNGKEIDPSIIFFPKEISPNQLPLYGEHIHYMYNPLYSITCCY